MKDNLMSGDVLHCKRNSFISRAIRRVTRSKKTSHTALVLCIYGDVYIVDSQADGTRLRTFDEWNEKFNYQIILTRPPYNVINGELLNKVKKYLNTSYGYIDLIRHIIYAKFGLWLGSRREDKHLVCSEFVMRIFGDPEAYRATPQDAYIFCLEEEFKIIDL